MKVSRIPTAPATAALLAVLLALLGLSACAGGARPSIDPVPSDPPPFPAHKPEPPALVIGLAQAPPVPAAVQVVALPLPAGSGRQASATWTAPAQLLDTRHYVVRRGDTLFGISRRLGVPLGGLIDANGLTPPYELRVGQTLATASLRQHEVRSGDTVYGVSRRYAVDLTELIRLNQISSPYRISPGQRLDLPGQAVQPAVAVVTPPGGGKPLVATVPVSKAASRTVPAVAPPRARLAAIPKPPPRRGGKFLWPVEGRVILGFGPKKGGLHNDGINISAPRGTPVQAAENGVVAYAGNELRGFGNLLLIKHSGGWITAYAHASEILVRRGETVRRGQTIARVGSTGNVAQPQLHFEVRKGTRAVDPTRLLGRQSAAG